MATLPDRSDEELIEFIPIDGDTWQEMGYRSRSEFVRWAELKREAWENNRNLDG